MQQAWLHSFHTARSGPLHTTARQGGGGAEAANAYVFSFCLLFHEVFLTSIEERAR